MISIIIPSLNEESIIERTVSNIKSKITIPHEIIVSDGKSTDRTVEIARRLADKVVEYTGTTRQNIAMGRNAGVKASSGDFLVFLDADCTIHEPDQFFTHALKHFEENPKLVAMTARLRVLPAFATLADEIVFGIMYLNLRFLNNVLGRGESTGEFQMMRRTTFDQLKGFREDLVTREDADMFLRLSKIGRTMVDPHLTVYHTGRRAHKIGWPKLLYHWFLNVFWVAVFDTAKHKEWTVIR
jgi:glycosyltransferase involved in cell wall biosynthesis